MTRVIELCIKNVSAQVLIYTFYVIPFFTIHHL